MKILSFIIFFLSSFSYAGNLSTLIRGSAINTPSSNISGRSIGTYFDIGGEPIYCRRSTLDNRGFYSYQSINSGFECASGKICHNSACVAGAPVCSISIAKGENCINNTIYAGYHNGYHYMTTPSGCSNSTTPICNGSKDTLAFDSVGAYSSIDLTNLTLNDGWANTNYLKSNPSRKAAIFCDQLEYAGFTDWFLPSEQEALVLLAGQSLTLGSVNTAYHVNYATSSYHPSSPQSFQSGFMSHAGAIAGDYYYNSILVRCLRKM